MNNSFNTYIHRQSFMHRLNPSMKLIGMIFLIIMVFLPLGFFGQAILLIIVCALWTTSKLPFKLMTAILKSTVFMFLVLFVINWLVYKTPGMIGNINSHDIIGHLWGSAWISPTGTNVPDGIISAVGKLWGGTCQQPQWFSTAEFKAGLPGQYIYQAVKNGYVVVFYNSTWYALSSQVIIYSLYVTLKIFLMIVVVTLFVSSTNAIQISFAIEDILNPLRYLKIPVNEWAMTISIALRFVPSLLQESQRIMSAQASRGVDFNNGNFKDKMKSLVSLVVPMFSIAFHKADDLANAMEARAYNPRYARTRYRNYAVNWFDWVLFLFLSFILGILLLFSGEHIFFAPFGWPDAILMYGA